MMHRHRGHTAVPVIDSDRDQGWWHQARCREPVTRDLWTSDLVSDRRTAAHQCLAHCPVIDQCAAEAVHADWRSATVGGVVYDYGGQVDDGFIPTVCRQCVTADRYEEFRNHQQARADSRARRYASEEVA